MLGLSTLVIKFELAFEPFFKMNCWTGDVAHWQSVLPSMYRPWIQSPMPQKTKQNPNPKKEKPTNKVYYCYTFSAYV